MFIASTLRHDQAPAIVDEAKVLSKTKSGRVTKVPAKTATTAAKGKKPGPKKGAAKKTVTPKKATPKKAEAAAAT